MILEDVPTDAELSERTLHKAGIEFSAKRVDNRVDFIEALKTFEPDIVLSDYKLPDFDGLSAIKLVREQSSDLPVILVTGALGDEMAVEIVKAGANDYILKDRLGRLPLAVQRALSAVDDIRKGREADAVLKASEARYRRLFEAATDGILILDAESGRILDINPFIINLLGYSHDEYLGKAIWDIGPLKDIELTKAAFAESKKNGYVHYEDMSLETKDGRRVDVELVSNVYKADRRKVIHYNIRDITERKRAESVLKRLNRALKTLSSGNEALVRATEEQDLLREMCSVLVESGGYRLAWIGFAEGDEAKTVRLMASAGQNAAFIEQAVSLGADSGLGLGLTSTAIRTGKSQINWEFATDPRMKPWRVLASKYGFGSSAAFPLHNKSGVLGALAIYTAESDAFDAAEVELLTQLANDLSYGIGALRERTEREGAVRRLHESLEATVGAIASTVEMRDPYTAGHQRRVARLAVAVARQMALTEPEIHGIYLAGIIHDVGKINVPAEILSKTGSLSKSEFDLISEHPLTGYNIVKNVDFPWPIAQTVLQHHERLDGSGYPNGIKGDRIIVEAKILAVADVVEAMTAHRPYRPALGLDAALAEIEKGKGRLYDPAAADGCLILFREKGFVFE